MADPRFGQLWVDHATAWDLGISPLNHASRIQRGDMVRTHGGSSRARFVGVSPQGVVWCAYDLRDFAPMCARFDARWGHV